MNIKDPETERLAAEVAELTGDTKAGAVRAALGELKARLAADREPEIGAPTKAEAGIVLPISSWSS
ncbi:type II toxin-antitoxin system VapB family antitoxin [Amycolatopsis sp. NPDC003731]